MRPLTAIIYRESKIRATNYVFVFWDLLFPLLYMLVFGVGINAALGAPAGLPGVTYNEFFLAGILAMASFAIASNTSWSFFLDRDNGIFFEMLTYPMSRSQYLLGKVIFNVCISVVQAALTLAAGRYLLGLRIQWSRLPLLLLVMAVGTAGWFFFYAIFALRIRQNDLFNSITSVFYFVFMFASSMFYPLDPLPAWLRFASWLNPITWEIDWLRFTSIGLGHVSSLIWEAGAFTLFALGCFLYAVRCLQRQE
jgi:ABC-2 type transport system permease protein